VKWPRNRGRGKNVEALLPVDRLGMSRSQSQNGNPKYERHLSARTKPKLGMWSSSVYAGPRPEKEVVINASCQRISKTVDKSNVRPSVRLLKTKGKVVYHTFIPIIKLKRLCQY